MNQLYLPAPDIGRYLNRVTCAEATDFLRGLPTGSVQTLITSPPYYGLRDYNVDGQIGLEETPAEFVAKLVAVFQEVRRVLRDDGCIWINLGDTYSAGGRGSGGDTAKQRSNKGTRVGVVKEAWKVQGYGEKQLIGIPWRVAFALQDDGWILRSDIIWSKPNPMPESVTDRPTKAHEYVFLLSKKPTYYYDADAIREPNAVNPNWNYGKSRKTSQDEYKTNGDNKRRKHSSEGWHRLAPTGEDGNGRNKRSVWECATEPTPFAHFATFPTKLITPMILAGAPVGGIVLDPFAGSGTTLLTARNLGRVGIGCDLNPEYAQLANDRLSKPFTLPMLEMFA